MKHNSVRGITKKDFCIICDLLRDYGYISLQKLITEIAAITLFTISERIDKENKHEIFEQLFAMSAYLEVA